jgi:hypothetical protein
VSHDRAAFGTAPWPYSGRGERRPQTARAHRTNSPLELPAALRGRGQSPEGRRWRDLCRHYGGKLGAERLADEATRALLLNLVDLTLRLERIRDSAQQPTTHTVLHLCQEQRTLLQQLGLSERSHGNNNGDSGPDLHDYLRSKDNGGAP